MLMRRAVLIGALLLVGLLMATVATWSLAFDMNSSNVAAWSGRWILARLPILVGLLMVAGGFRLLSATRVPRPIDDFEDENRTD